MSGRRSSAKVTTLRPGDLVTVRLRFRHVDDVNTWAGEIVDADAAAIRIRAFWYRIGLSPRDAEGERIIPWSRIDDIRIEPATRVV